MRKVFGVLKVLYVASEAVPFVKTGGLADVAGALPKELKKQGVDVRVVIPKYSGIKEEYRNEMEHIYDGTINVAWRQKYIGVDRYDYKNVPFYFVDNQEYFYREGYYGYPDDVERFLHSSAVLYSICFLKLISGQISFI